MRNFASWGAGARIIPHFTSPTHALPTQSWLGIVRSSIAGYDVEHLEINCPNTLLEDNIDQGQCLEFSGSRGQVGIRLSEQITISHVSVKYPSPLILTSSELAKAPRNISIWGLLDADSPLPVFIHPTDKHVASAFVLDEYQCDPTPSSSSLFVWLVDIQYNVTEADQWQTFAVKPIIAGARNIGTVVVNVESNEGAETTCLYWIGIHGCIEL
jgi:hypothetical protein